MDGTLVRYGPKAPCVAFISPCPAQKKAGGVQNKALVAVGGLSCGLLFAEYLKPLSTELSTIDVYLCQPLLSSSHNSWGTASVSKDAAELDTLLEYLHTHFRFTEFVLLGHSTGCQDAVMYMRKFANAGRARGFRVSGVVLQGPVSDREFLAGFLPDVKEKIDMCRRMEAEGRSEDIGLLFRWEEGADDVIPVTARRFLSLADIGGEDDMFSSNGLDLNEALSSLRGVPTLVLMSGADECQVDYIDPAEAGQQLAGAIGSSAQLKVIDGGLHDLKGKETSDVAANIIKDFVAQTMGI